MIADGLGASVIWAALIEEHDIANPRAWINPTGCALWDESGLPGSGIGGAAHGHERK
ncbi:hypothetical protein [Streptomyces sp. MZ04]|uniref:hypothetical protein n=1 Tax=Streptomyces sp. MZ04 TaxID=2559236 RepID=UPI001432B70E|nr:hypothetical protein [Streptomyces sp. MZ04]